MASKNVKKQLKKCKQTTKIEKERNKKCMTIPMISAIIQRLNSFQLLLSTFLGHSESSYKIINSIFSACNKGVSECATMIHTIYVST